MEIIEMENNFPAEFLCQSHLDFLVGFLELAAQRDQAIMDQFFSLKEIS